MLSTLSALSTFVFISIPPPPRSTLFPYTTLFRSNVFVRARSVTDAMRLSLLGASSEGNRQRIADVAFPRRAAVDLDAEARDRKSTRLNSSHRCISYAVFCLKKKKNKQAEERHDAA